MYLQRMPDDLIGNHAYLDIGLIRELDVESNRQVDSSRGSYDEIKGESGGGVDMDEMRDLGALLVEI